VVILIFEITPHHPTDLHLQAMFTESVPLLLLHLAIIIEIDHPSEDLQSLQEEIIVDLHLQVMFTETVLHLLLEDLRHLAMLIETVLLQGDLLLYLQLIEKTKYQ